MSWVGCGVSVDCGEALGSFQGTIVEADGTKITLNRAFRNGLPCPKSRATINASDIKDIQFIHNGNGPDQSSHSTVEVIKKKVPKVVAVDSKAHSKHSAFVGSFNSLSLVKTKPIDIRQRSNAMCPIGTSAASSTSATNPMNPMNPMNAIGTMSGTTPNKKEKERRRNELCFGTPSDDPIMTEEFDFEKNLALFDKRALWEELNQAQKPDIVRQTDGARRNQPQPKYRHDENILESQPVTHRAIAVPEEGKGPKEYVTDEGFVIPSLTNQFRMRLFAACGQAGLEGAELFARAGAEVALQLLGGTRRLHPRNIHQMPTVAFLIGPHRQGAVGVTCARQLASHGVSTVVLVASADVQGALRQHLSAYQMTGNRLTTNIQELPTVDLIIMALCDDSPEPTAYPHLAEWVGQSRAPVLALDPPAVGTPNIVARYSLLPILPLSHSADSGKLYLCNLAVPQKIFKDLGIRYTSPFGAKFVIALHPNH